MLTHYIQCLQKIYNAKGVIVIRCCKPEDRQHTGQKQKTTYDPQTFHRKLHIEQYEPLKNKFH